MSHKRTERRNEPLWAHHPMVQWYVINDETNRQNKALVERAEGIAEGEVSPVTPILEDPQQLTS